MGISQSAKEQIYNVLRERIIYLYYYPNQPLNESEICEEFNISRTPLREALLQLQEQKLIRIIPRSGTFVENIDLLELRDLLLVKQELEGLAAALAADTISQQDLDRLSEIVEKIEENIEGDSNLLTSLDQEFHHIVHNSIFNETLKDLLFTINARSARGWLFYKDRFEGFTKTFLDLRDIYFALKDKNPEDARLSARKHTNTFLGLIKKGLQ